MNALCRPLGQDPGGSPVQAKAGGRSLLPHISSDGVFRVLYPSVVLRVLPEHASEFDDVVSGGAPAPAG